MNFLYVHVQNSICDFATAMIVMGHKLTLLPDIVMDPINPIEEHREHIIKAIEKERPDYVISYLFIPIVSEVTHSYGIPYISWTYDSPLTSLFSNALHNDNNYIFVFDKAECRRLKELSSAKIFHLPMAANLDRIGGIDLTDEEIPKFSSDISFVGTLYQQNTYNGSIGYLDELTQLELKHYLLTHMRTWDKVKPWPVLSEHATTNILKLYNADKWNKTLLSDAAYMGLLFLTRKLAEIDRVTILNALAEHHKVDLYTGDMDNPSLVNVTCHDRVDYESDMSKVFYCSKINLNITLPSIETGVPQRVFDIMGCGGFVLTNYQEEMDDLFTIGKDIEVFRNTDELLDKAAYYLSHERERLQIAINGYKTICARHSYTQRINEMLDIVRAN